MGLASQKSETIEGWWREHWRLADKTGHCSPSHVVDESMIGGRGEKRQESRTIGWDEIGIPAAIALENDNNHMPLLHKG